jgi:hypothetical protein
MRRGLRVFVATATLFAISGIAGVAPLTGPSPAAPVADEISLLHRTLIYAKEGSHRSATGVGTSAKPKQSLASLYRPKRNAS